MDRPKGVPRKSRDSSNRIGADRTAAATPRTGTAFQILMKSARGEVEEPLVDTFGSLLEVEIDAAGAAAAAPEVAIIKPGAIGGNVKSIGAVVVAASVVVVTSASVVKTN